MTVCLENHIYGKSKQILKEDGINDHFDLFIFASSWESRCIEIIKYDSGNFIFDSSIVLSFKLGGEKGYSQKYLNEITSFTSKKIKKDEIKFIKDEPDELKKVTKEIKDKILYLLEKLQRPLYIGIDITSCPRYFFLYLLGFCINHDITKKISFFYSEGRFEIDTKKYIRTKGNWKVKLISEFEAKYDPTKKKMFVVSAGFEGNQYRSLVFNNEPDNLGILLPSPGFNLQYEKKSEEECQQLIDEFNVKDTLIKAPAGDAIAAWSALKNPSVNKKDLNIIFFTFGPKPHALAMGVHGLLNKNISVAYRVPDGYHKLDVIPTEKFWRYDIRNLIYI